MDELDELIEEFEWRASMEGELANSAFAKESFDSFERYKRNKNKYNRVAELLKELKEYRCKEMASESDFINKSKEFEAQLDKIKGLQDVIRQIRGNEDNDDSDIEDYLGGND